jgi:hypothetical protein
MTAPARSSFRRVLLWTSALALAGWACGDGGDGVTPPTTENPVATVTVTPSQADVEVGSTVQFTATPRDADGKILTGREITWSVSPEAVATVSSSGMATGLESGSATVTATSEGRSGTATLGVQSPEVLATGTVGPGGGDIGNDDVGVTVPPGQLTTSTTVEIRASDDSMEEFGDDLVTGTYRLTGFPEDREVEVRVRLRTNGTLRDQSYIGMAVPAVRSSTDTLAARRGLVLEEAVDSAGYLVATVPVRGNGGQSNPAGPQRASSGGIDHLLDGLLGGVTGVHTDTVPGNHFVIVSYGAPWTELQPLVGRAAELMEDARVTMLAQGYSFDHRTEWPIEVRVYPMDEGDYGAFVQKLPWPLDVNTGYFELNTWAFSQPDMPGTAIHEFYHFVQARYTAGLLAAQAYHYGWLEEAASTWVEVKAPETIGVFRNTFFQAHRRNLFTGLYRGLASKHGYGKAPIVMYVADRWGTEQVRGIWESVAGGSGAVDALLQGIPEDPETWWPDLLTKYMKGEIVSLAPEDLPPETSEFPIKGGTWRWSRSLSLRPGEAQFRHFEPDPDRFGTGTTLTFRLPKDLREAGFRILPFRMDASGQWEEQGGLADSLVIEGPDLRLGRRYGFFTVHTDPKAPYTQSWSNQIDTDLGYVEGDWMPRDVAVVDDGIVYVRPDEEDDTKIDVADNIVSMFESLASNGIWERSETNPNRYVWKPTAAFADQLAAYETTAESEALVRAGGDSLLITAMFDMAPPSGSGAGPGLLPGNGGWTTPGLPGVGWGVRVAMGAAGLLLLLGLGFGLRSNRLAPVLRPNRRALVLTAAAAAGLVFWGCDLGTISFTARFRYEFRFGSPAFTASAEDESVPLLQVSDGTGVLKVDRYRSEWWKYIRDEDDVVVDSVAQVRTASGQATVELEADLFQDGVVTNDESSLRLKASRLFQLPPSALRR